MPHCSAWTPCGLLTLSDEKPLAQAIYESSAAAYGGQISTEEGSRLDAHLYAQAIGLAAASATIQHAAAQAFPSGLLEMLPVRERELQIVPGPTDTVAERRAVVAARRRLPLPPTRTNIENALRDVLGDDFLELRTTSAAGAFVWPASASATQLHFAAPNAPIKYARLADAVTPGARTVPYQSVSLPMSPQPAPSPDILVDDVLLVDPENSARSETVTVTAANAGAFTATFTQAHDEGCLATTASLPQWQSSKRASLIIVSASAARDPVKRAKVDDIMRRMARAVSTWSITSGGPFKVGRGRLGVTTIGAI